MNGMDNSEQKLSAFYQLKKSGDLLLLYGEIPAGDPNAAEYAKSRILSELHSIVLALHEIDEFTTAETARRLTETVERIPFQPDTIVMLAAALKEFVDGLPREETLNAIRLGRMMNRVKLGHFPTDLHHVKLLRESLIFPETPINLLDPCCGTGSALSELAAGSSAVTYGVEIDGSRAEQAAQILNRVAFGSFFLSRISRAFHAVFLNPPYLNVRSETGGVERHEASFLGSSLRTLADGGILIYIIPYYRLSDDIADVLAEYFDELSVYRFKENIFNKFKQIVVLGKKRRKERMSKEIAQWLKGLAYSPDSIPCITELVKERYALPDEPLSVGTFRGSQFNEYELDKHLQSSKSLDCLFDDSKLSVCAGQSLLPLKAGQIGLIGGSGLINGLIDCHAPHVVKGVVKKTVKSTISEDEKQMTEVESSVLRFTVLTPDGCLRLT